MVTFYLYVCKSITRAGWGKHVNTLSPTEIQDKHINSLQFKLPGTGEWRPSRHVLVIYLDIYRIRIHHCVVVGKGFDSTHRWRSIPLGIGVLLTPIPKVPQLHHWLDVRTGIAIRNSFWTIPHRHHHSGIDQCPQSGLWSQRLARHSTCVLNGSSVIYFQCLRVRSNANLD